MAGAVVTIAPRQPEQESDLMNNIAWEAKEEVEKQKLIKAAARIV